jgi:hypothetical protein
MQRELIETLRKEAKFLLESNPLKVPLGFGKGTKLSPRFVGPFTILERIGPVAYKLELPFHLRRMHNVFHVSMLRKYVPDPSHVLKFEKLQVSEEGVLQVEPFCILDRRVRRLRNREFEQVKVQWDQYSPGSATWEDAWAERASSFNDLVGAHTYEGEYIQSNTLWDRDKLNQPFMLVVLFPCIILDGTWDHLEIAKVPYIGVVMSKSRRRVGVVLVNGVVGLDFDGWGYVPCRIVEEV